MARVFRKLAQLLDVDVVSTPPADGDALTFDDGSGKWVPAAGGGGGAARSFLPGIGDLRRHDGSEVASGVGIGEPGTDVPRQADQGDKGAGPAPP